MAITAGRRDVTPMGNTRTKEFICVRVRLPGSNRQECAERVAAEAWEAGASGVEEQALREGDGERLWALSEEYVSQGFPL